MHETIERRRRPEIYYKLLILLFLAISVIVSSTPVGANARVGEPVVEPLHYADIADLAAAAPMIIKGRIRGAKKVNAAPSPGSVQPVAYYFVRADVEALIRGDEGVPSEISFLVRAGDDDRGKADKPRRNQTVMLFVRKAGGPSQVQLVSRRAMLPWTDALEATTRAITAELLQPDAPPAIVSVGDAFHIPGTIAGEGETQIFLKTATGAPVSLSILHRPGQMPRWGVSLGEIVDETATPPARETLLWYRLACGLPGRLPAESTRGLPPRDAEAARRDYRMVIESLGSCGRTL